MFILKLRWIFHHQLCQFCINILNFFNFLTMKIWRFGLHQFFIRKQKDHVIWTANQWAGILPSTLTLLVAASYSAQRRWKSKLYCHFNWIFLDYLTWQNILDTLESRDWKWNTEIVWQCCRWIGRHLSICRQIETQQTFQIFSKVFY